MIDVSGVIRLSDVDNAIERLQIAAAQTRAARVTAMHTAEMMSRQRIHAAQVGFRRVAAELDGVEQQLKSSVSRHDTSTAHLDTATSAMVSTRNVGTPRDVLDLTTNAHRSAQSAASEVRVATEMAAAIVGKTAAALDGGQPGPLLALLENLKRQLSDALGRLGEASLRIEAASAVAARLGEPPSATSSASGDARPDDSKPLDDEASDGYRLLAVFRTIGEKGISSRVRTVGTAAEVEAIYARLAAGGRPVDVAKPGAKAVVFPDGTHVVYRRESRSGGPAVDIQVRGKKFRRVHVA